jgi:hypothetical protein
MARERWGSFSVADHLKPRAFVADVLLYDKLVIPYPPDGKERERWAKKKWDPAKLSKVLKLLDEYELVEQIPWDGPKIDFFKSRAAMARQLDNEMALGMTRWLLADKFKPETDIPGPKPWIVPAYPSPLAFKKEVRIGKPKPYDHSDLCVALSNRFLVPSGPDIFDSKLELLRKAADIAKDSDFIANRKRFYDWQDRVAREGYSQDEAEQEMNRYLEKYKKLVKKAWRQVYWRVSFTLVSVGASLAGTLMGNPLLSAGTAVSGIGSLASLAQFIKFDMKPNIQEDECMPAAMFHAARKHLGFQ